MERQHTYAVRAEWTGDLGQGTASYRGYGRDVTLRVPGKPPIEASADVPFIGDRTKWNPEDFLVAALVQCHLYSYLYACTKVGVVVVGYSDDATGTMVETGEDGSFSEVVLRPRVTVADADMVERALAAHEDAHAMCFIAKSVAFPVRHIPEIRVAPGVSGARGGAPA